MDCPITIGGLLAAFAGGVAFILSLEVVFVVLVKREILRGRPDRNPKL